MKANELMLGDLVRFKCTHPQLTPNIVAVFGIVFDSKVSKKHLVHIVFKETGLVQYNYDPDVFEGVPLTPEILKKNGWWKYGPYFSNNNVDFELEPYRDGGFGIRVSADEYGSGTFAGIEYVHELQHAIRLCGIEKEILI